MVRKVWDHLGEASAHFVNVHSDRGARNHFFEPRNEACRSFAQSRHGHDVEARLPWVGELVGAQKLLGRLLTGRVEWRNDVGIATPIERTFSEARARFAEAGYANRFKAEKFEGRPQGILQKDPEENATLAKRALVVGAKTNDNPISIARFDAPMKLLGSAALSVLTTKCGVPGA